MTVFVVLLCVGLASALRSCRCQSNATALATAKNVLKSKLTFLSLPKLEKHVRLIEEVERNCVDGVILEAGVAHGGSSLVFAAAKCPDRGMVLYDTFRGIPPPTEKDPNEAHARFGVIRSGKAGANYYGYEKDLLALVQRRHAAAGSTKVEFVPGLYNKTMLSFDRAVAYAHIDCDWYDSVKIVLRAILPRMPVGGIVVADDYFTWGGATHAWDEIFASEPSGVWQEERDEALGLIWAQRKLKP